MALWHGGGRERGGEAAAAVLAGGGDAGRPPPADGQRQLQLRAASVLVFFGSGAGADDVLVGGELQVQRPPRLLAAAAPRLPAGGAGAHELRLDAVQPMQLVNLLPEGLLMLEHGHLHHLHVTLPHKLAHIDLF